jgi:hypothetical protein
MTASLRGFAEPTLLTRSFHFGLHLSFIAAEMRAKGCDLLP